MVDFFNTDSYLDLPVGERNFLEVVDDATPEQLRRWSEEAARMGGATDTAGSDASTKKLVQLTVSTPFLVFTVDVVALLGMTIIPPKTGKKSPEMQFVLIDSRVRGDGPPPIVWIFNRLMGLDRSAAPNGEYEQPHHCLYRVKAVKAEGEKGQDVDDIDDDGEDIAFASKMHAELNVNFPSVLLNLLPVDKSVIERQGCKSLKESMDRDIAPGIEKFRDHYLDWLKQPSS